MSETGNEPTDALACVVLTHADPVHLHRLVGALDPFPVFVHVDNHSSDAVFAAMIRRPPRRVTFMPRRPSGWAKWETVAAEIDGYRAALRFTDAPHIALLTGSDYPLAGTAEIAATLAGLRGRSIAENQVLPLADWGRFGGFDRFKVPNFAWRKHRIPVPVPRRIPADLTPAGGSQVKILSREHAQLIVDLADSRPDLIKFFQRVWIADETFVPSLLLSAALGARWATESVQANLWWIGWDDTARKSPPWLTDEYFDRLQAGRTGADGSVLPKLFARKFSTQLSTDLLDRIDRELRSVSFAAGAEPAA